ncbi:MAG: transcription termination factor NusA [bacterium]
MNNELAAILGYMEKERGINRETLFLTLEDALLTASRKSVGPARNLRVSIDRKSAAIKAFATVTVVERVTSKHDQITYDNARRNHPDAHMGDQIEIEVTPKNFGRIAAQTAKQAILQRLRQAERSNVFEEYRSRVGDIVSGSILRFERSDIIVNLGRAEALMPAKERISSEIYQMGDRVRAYVMSVQNNDMGPSVILSRAAPEFVRRLFELEVAEIADKTVEIKAIAREPGFRTKIAVTSRDAKVDPVGACVGMRGIRVKNIVRELNGEKVDIVRWSEDIKTYIGNALSPAKLLKIEIDPEIPGVVHITTDAEHLSLAIGRRGQNVRLTSKLLGWKVDIQRDEGDITFVEKVSRAVDSLAAIPGISHENAQKLVEAGFLNIEGILAADLNDLEELGFDATTAKSLYEAAASAQQQTEPIEPEPEAIK